MTAGMSSKYIKNILNKKRPFFWLFFVKIRSKAARHLTQKIQNFAASGMFAGPKSAGADAASGTVALKTAHLYGILGKSSKKHSRPEGGAS